MPRRKSENLTEVEQRVMEVLWTAGSGTVSEVLAALRTPKPLAFNTVQTMLRILEQKRYVRHAEEGRAFRYFPLVDKAEASRVDGGGVGVKGKRRIGISQRRRPGADGDVEKSGAFRPGGGIPCIPA